jgi:pyruvate-ferredoxin/flavodoxin oxidoreductase
MSIKKVMDGNEAAAYISYAFTEIAAIYPITPSSPMAEKTDEWSAKGMKNIFGQTVSLVEMQSEAGAAGALHGALETGSYATSYTSSQGLLLMIPVMHRIAGCRLPAVLHIASRTVGTHAMSIFGDHSDVMNCRQTGFSMLSSANAQEVMDLGAVAHLSAIHCNMPFMHFFDGFRTSHEIQKIDLIDYEDLKTLIDSDAVHLFRSCALNPEHPTLRNTVQNPDIYFQVREANNSRFDRIPLAVETYMEKINALTGRNYSLINYYGAIDAEHVIVAMGSVSGAIQETVEYLMSKGEKVGFLQVHLYRPFPVEHLLKTVPKTAKIISVLDRTKESGAAGEPLYQDICAAYANDPHSPVILGGRYGLSSKDTTPSHIKAVFENKTRSPFTIGIIDDVTHLSLPEMDSLYFDEDGTVSCKFWGLGSDGTVGANKNSIKIIGDNTDMFVQAYFEYDTKKSYGVTKSHVRFGKNPIRSSYLVKRADFIACHNQSYLWKYDIVSELKVKGVFLLNCDFDENNIGANLPATVKRYLAGNKIRFYIIDANAIAHKIGLGNRANAVLQAAFFRLSGIIPIDEAVDYMKKAASSTYRKKGDDVVALNLTAIDEGVKGVKNIEVPDEWAKVESIDVQIDNTKYPDFIRNILIPINAQRGDSLPVSAFGDHSDGTMPLGTTAFEKRGIANVLPVWLKDNCIQCNKCALVCPHAVIRPYLLNDSESGGAPDGFEMISSRGKTKDLWFSIQISDLDCTGCGCCANVCPAKEKALTMVVAKQKKHDPSHWEYGLSISEKTRAFDPRTIKGSQFKQPLCEFSGACAGCGETPYAKLLTQLFGDKMYWANATGCSQAWGAAMPSIPYTKNKRGEGPAWSNSLFENNAEFGLGMLLSEKQQRGKINSRVRELRERLEGFGEVYAHITGGIDDWLLTFDDIEKSAESSRRLEPLIRELLASGEAELRQLATAALSMKNYMSKKTVWMYGGDGWAYDIGYGGLDHVVAMGEDINVFIVDTEVYSNTGGQSSKATPLGAVAQFQSSGKRTPKKNLGKQMMSYGNVYVASVSMGANPNQLIQAILEAESFNGPSIIIAYSPCVAHGIKAGMDKAQDEMKRAVESGYWPLYRYDPRKDDPFQLDHKTPSMPLTEFLEGEVRYASLALSFPDNAKKLFLQAEDDVKRNMAEYKSMGKHT